MNKNINYLGTISLPWNKFFKLLSHSSTEEVHGHHSNILTNRTQVQKKLQKKILLLYPKISQKFYRYTNQKFFSLIPNNFWKKFKVKKDGARVSVLKHTPGTFTAPHIDTYDNFFKGIGKLQSNKNRNQVVRIWISMVKPKLGHALFVGNEVAYNLKKGTAIKFNHNVYHSGCNAGWEDRFILTVTGWKDGQ
jgi:hypothetical protein